MSDPRPLSFSLPDARRRLIRAANTGTGDELDPELEEVRRRGMDEIMAARWSTVMLRYAGAIWEQVQPGAVEKLRAWMAMSKPANLVVLGPPGTGKSSAAALALRQAFDSCLEVRFVAARSLLNDLMPDCPDRFGALADYCEVDRLLIDDVGKEKPTPWTVEQLDHIISDRYNTERPVVVTSNFNEKDLEAHLGAHAADRLLGDGAVIVVMRGQSRRRS